MLVVSKKWPWRTYPSSIFPFSPQYLIITLMFPFREESFPVPDDRVLLQKYIAAFGVIGSVFVFIM